MRIGEAIVPLVARNTLRNQTIWDNVDAFRIMNYSWYNHHFRISDLEKVFPNIPNLKGLINELTENRILIPINSDHRKMEALITHIGKREFLERYAGKKYETVAYYFNFPRIFLRALSILGFNVDSLAGQIPKRDLENHPKIFDSKNFQDVIIAEYLQLKKIISENSNNPIEMESTKNELLNPQFPLIHEFLYHYLENDYSLTLKNNIAIHKKRLTDMEGFLQIMREKPKSEIDSNTIKPIAIKLYDELVKNFEKNISIDSYILQFSNFYLINYPEIIEIASEESLVEIKKFREYLFLRHEKFSPIKMMQTKNFIEKMP